MNPHNNMEAETRLYHQPHKPVVQPPDNTVRVYNMTTLAKKQHKKRRPGWLLPVLGVLLGVTFLALGVCIVIVNPLDYAIAELRRFGPGTFMFSSWMNPPTKVNLMFYGFNYTNSEAFLRGEEVLRIQQIGPYSFTEVSVNRNVTFNENGTVTYIPTHIATFDPEMSAGDPLMDTIVVPNLAFLGLASYLADSSYFTNTAFNFFTRMVKSKPFLTLTVDEYLRGYDEPLINYAQKIVPGMASFGSMGFLDRIVNEGVNIVTMSTNDETMVTSDGRVIEPFTVDQYNGSPGMSHWGYREEDNTTHKTCNTLQGIATHGVIVPREIFEDTRIYFHRKSFCRTIPVVYDRDGVTSKGVPAYWLKFSEDAFHNTNPENSCFCDQEEKECLPDGLSDISPCMFGLPLAISSPHFLYGDPSLAEAWAGLNPTFEDHGSKGLMDKNFGVILHANIRIQLNLVMKKTKYNALAAPFNGMVLPAVWAEYRFHDLPELQHTFLYIAVFVVPVIHYVIIAVLIMFGVALLLYSLLAQTNTKAVYRRLNLFRASPKS